MILFAQRNTARWIFLMVTSICHAHLVLQADDNFTDNDWQNETQLFEMFEYDNQSENYTTENYAESDMETTEVLENSSIGQKADKSGNNAKIEFPFEELRQHRHYARFVFMVLLLHIAVVGVGITVYCCVFCNVRTWKRRTRLEAHRRLQMTSLQSPHIPNDRDCPCKGCILAREMLQSLIMQQLQELAEC
ncbi:hypothetical protein M5D96_006947 [Drosophila gunungcola]|uniref:Uncharacterized protein n=2 Tax=Drosophila gunungcola TaxID=103775 RepID=A0A9P9YM37_9MUSC|nr:hypothetical protein M5D96_006947 [Drosophila gunungcola]